MALALADSGRYAARLSDIKTAMIDLLGQRGFPRWPAQAIEPIRSLLTWFHQARIGPWRAAAVLLCAVACVGIVLEMRTSLIESLVFSRLTREMTFHVPAPKLGFHRAARTI